MASDRLTTVRLVAAALGLATAAFFWTTLAGCGDAGTSETGTTEAGTSSPDAVAAGGTEPEPAAPSPPPIASPADAAGSAPPPAAGSPPRLVFDRPTHDFGTIMETDVVTATFRVGNEGGSPLRILDVKTSCGCTLAELGSYVLEPGASTTLTAEYEPNQVSTNGRPMVKFITLRSNDPADPTARCRIRAVVEPFIDIQPPNLLFGQRLLGERFARTLRVTSPDPAFELLSVVPEGDMAEVRILPLDEAMRHLPAGAPPQDRIVEVVFPSSTPWGGAYFAIEFTGRGRPRPSDPVIEHASTIRVGGRFYGVLEASMDRFGVAARPNQPIELDRTLSRVDGRPLTIEQAMIVDWDGGSPLSVTTKRLGPSKWSIVLTGQAPNRVGTFGAEIVIVTDVDDPREREIRMPIHVPVRAG